MNYNVYNNKYNKKMKLSIISFCILSSFTHVAMAEYNIKYNLENKNGGSLPSGSIQFKNKDEQTKWIPTDPIISEWVNDGDIFDCSNWSPLENTVSNGISFEQKSTSCKQNQTRTLQNREKNEATNEYRNVGNLSQETRTLTDKESSRNGIGTKQPEECDYKYGGAGVLSAWFKYDNTNQFQVWWKGSLVVGLTSAPDPTTYTSNGYVYTRSGPAVDTVQANSTTYYYYHKICRSKI